MEDKADGLIRNADMGATKLRDCCQVDETGDGRPPLHYLDWLTEGNKVCHDREFWAEELGGASDETESASTHRRYCFHKWRR